MYIERLRVKNVRLLAEQEFSFLRDDGTLRQWTVLVGENGLCKSTILQAIALTALGPKLATALAQDSQRFRSIETRTPASMTATFRPTNGQAGSGSVVSSLVIEPGRHDLVGGQDFTGASFLDEIRAYRQPGWFIAGYGVGRFLPRPGEVALPGDPIVDRVEGLFDLHHKMLGMDFYSVLREQGLATRFSRVLREVLLASGSQEALLPWLKDLELRGRGGVSRIPALLQANRFEISIGGRSLKLPAGWLSDGYQTMLAWIADLLGHAFLDRKGEVEPSDMQGIVLLDEIDLHLHPTWQRRIVPMLKQIFPRLQFIVTTHSPLILAGFDREEIFRLKLEDGLVVLDPAGIEPGVLTASEILTNFFEVQHAGRPELVQKERRYLELRALKKPSTAERKELEGLRQELEPYWTTSGPTELLSPQEILHSKP